MEKATAKTKRKVKLLKQIVKKYDENLCQKANKQDVLEVDNKLRHYVKRVEYDDFVEQTQSSIVVIDKECKKVVTVVAKVTKTLPGTINEQVRHAVKQMRSVQAPISQKFDLDNLIVGAHLETRKGDEATKDQQSSRKKEDGAISEVKKSLVEMLSSRAGLDDLEQLKLEKTNKSDTELIMKSIDIMHKQLLQLSTIMLESLKSGISTRLENETEK